MCELDWEGLEGVTLRHIVLNTMLEFGCSEVSTSNSLELIIGESSGEQVAQLSVPLRVHVVFIASQTTDLLLQYALEHLFLLRGTERIAGHQVADA